jgi:multiple antibiotic resistance protein
MNLFLVSFGALFSIINPLGTLPIFIGLTKDKSKSEMNHIAIWASINACIILTLSFYLGTYFLRFFAISLDSLKIAGGLIIATSGFALLSGNFSKHKGMKEREKKDAYTRSEISLTPLAIPMLAGPSSISFLITLNEENQLMEEKMVLIASISGACLATLLILISSRYIMKALGASGVNALSRIIGFIEITIGVEYILSTLIGIGYKLSEGS